MTVKIPIEDNTTLLNALKTKAQSLPDGGSSGGDIDLSGVTAGASDVLYGKVIVGANGLEVVGMMPNKGAWNSTATSNGSVAIPEGYHNGSGKVTVNVPSSSTIPSDGDAATSDVRSGKTFYSGGSKKTGTMSTVTLGTPSIAVSSFGVITAEVKHSSSGYVASGTKQATKQMSTYGGGTRTPSKDSQTVSLKGKYCFGDLTINGDSNLVAANIKSGVSIFGVAGSYTGNGSSSCSTQELSKNITSETSSTYVSGLSFVDSADQIKSVVIVQTGSFDGINANEVIFGYVDKQSGKAVCITKNSIGHLLLDDTTNCIEANKSGSTLRVESQYYKFYGSYTFYVTYSE